MKPEERKHHQTLWQQRISHWQQSGLSAAAWCKQQDIKQHLFFYWKRKLLAKPDNNLVPLGVASPEPLPAASLVLYIDAIRIEAVPEQAAALIKALRATS